MKTDRPNNTLMCHYTPDTYLKPIMIVSCILDFNNNTGEIALGFINALNFQHAMTKCYSRDDKDRGEDYSDFVIYKKFKSTDKGLAEFNKLATKTNWNKYLKLLDKYCTNKEVIRR